MLAQAPRGSLDGLVILFGFLADQLQQTGLLFGLFDGGFDGFDLALQLHALGDRVGVIGFDALFQSGQLGLEFFELFLHGWLPLFLKFC